MSINSPIRTFGYQLARAAAAAVAVVLVSRWMGAEGRGELSILLFYVQFIMVANEYVGGSSLSNMIVKYPLSRLLPFSMFWSLLVCLAGGAVIYVSTRNAQLTLQILFLSFPLALLTTHYNLNQGLAMVQRRNVVQLFLELLKLALIMALGAAAWFAWDRGPQLRVDNVVYSYGIATILALILSFLFLRKHVAGAFSGKFSPPAELFTSGFWSQNGQLIQFLNYRLSLVLLTEMLGSHAAAGVYSNALLIADSIWIFGNSFGSIAHMRILQSENHGFRADITLRYAGISILGTALACAILPLIPQTVFVKVFGEGFETLKYTALWLIPSIMALGASTMFSHYITAMGRFRTIFFINASGLLTQVLLSLWLIPEMGLKGACISADAGFTLILILVVIVFKRDHPNARIHGALRLKPLLRVLFRS